MRWDGKPFGTASAYGQTAQFGQQRTDATEGTYGLKKSYLMSTPKAEFAPMNGGGFQQFLQAWQVRASAAAASATASTVAAFCPFTPLSAPPRYVSRFCPPS